jgi:hypothetical protein
LGYDAVVRLSTLTLLCGTAAACTTFDAATALDAGADALFVPGGDAGDAGPDGSDAGDAGPPKKRIFLSASSFDGNLVGQAAVFQLDAGTSGTAAADALCTREAKLEQLGGARWVAWLSASGEAPLARIRDRGPRYAVTGEQLLRGLGDLPLRPITLPDGGSPEGGEAWTGTENNGMPAINNCFLWTSNGGYQGTVGSPAVPTTWSSAFLRTCASAARLYCVED